MRPPVKYQHEGKHISLLIVIITQISEITTNTKIHRIKTHELTPYTVIYKYRRKI